MRMGNPSLVLRRSSSAARHSIDPARIERPAPVILSAADVSEASSRKSKDPYSHTNLYSLLSRCAAAQDERPTTFLIIGFALLVRQSRRQSSVC